LKASAIAAALATALLTQNTPVLAGVTGDITGVIRAPGGAPIGGVAVKAVAPSMTRTATTDAGGHFVILALAPDTYTIYLSRLGFADLSFSGVTVFADQAQAVAYTMKKALPTIARVASSPATSLVNPGVGIDVYSVNSAQAAAAAALGGPGNLNNAYSALALVPGVQVPQGGIGWFYNAAYVRGQNYDYVGYEYDGVPVTRAFDNYNASTEPSIGLQELQVYPGGGPSSVATAGTAGFINQVIKTGTFPGSATANIGIGAPAFYHQAQVEIGGSTPDRNFSYYAGFMGYNQTYRIIDNSNGAGYGVPGGIFSGDTSGPGIEDGYGSSQVLNVGYMCLSGTCQGVKPVCPLYGSKFTFPDQGCWQYTSNVSGNALMVTDRENVVNLHVGIPKTNGLRDDVQLLWSGSALNNYGYNSPSDFGPGVNQFIYSLFNTKYAPPICTHDDPFATWNGQVVLSGNGCTSPGGSAQQIISFLQTGHLYPGSGPRLCPADPIACAQTYVGYADNITYNLPFGTPIAASSTNFKVPFEYSAPGTPPHPFFGPLPLYDNSMDVNRNDTGIAKLQYTRALSQSAYLRAYAYTFYSDWFATDPTAAATFGLVSTFPGTPDYQLVTHTSGGALQFADQIGPKNLLSVDANYATASVTRINNLTALGGLRPFQTKPLFGAPIGYMAATADGYTCYDPSTGTPVTCIPTAYYDTSAMTPSGRSCGQVLNGKPCVQYPTWVGGAMTGPPNWPTSFAPAGSPAVKAGAAWDTLWNGDISGSYNSVRPRFTNASVQDQFRPNDSLTIDAAIRYDDFLYELPDSLTAATQFYAHLLANYSCVQVGNDEVLMLPLDNPPYSTQYVDGDCNEAARTRLHDVPHTGWVHPNGTVQDGVQAPNFSTSSPSSYSLDYWEPRFSGTYALNPNIVIRASIGRFVEPPVSAVLQYLSHSGDETQIWTDSMSFGFYSPFHPIPGVSSANYDVSWEQHLRGTDLSFKLTPFFTWVKDWQQLDNIGGLFTQIPVGVNRDEGVEFQFAKGDLTRNGLSTVLSLTYTDSKIQFQNVPLLTGDIVPDQIIGLNQAISQYNALTKAGGGSPCYQYGRAVSCSIRNNTIHSGYDTIFNPYYNSPVQGLLDESGWYNPVGTATNITGAVSSYISPFVSGIVLNWKHNKLAVTPTFNFQTGGYYGSPYDTTGLDPRACMKNSATTGIRNVSPKTNPLQCNYLYVTVGGLSIPDPQTGSFLFDNYQQPSSIVGNLQLTYDLSPHVRLTMLGTTLFHACFAGTAAPWTAAYPPGYVICGYSPAGVLYPSNFYNGTGINDFKANGARTPWTQSYLPSTGNNGAVGGAVQPINLYLNAQVKI
jgi:hypothetical protein